MDLQRIIENTYEDPNCSYNGTSCWIWKGAIVKQGYGVIWEDGRQWRVHRYAYVCVNGLIDDDEIVRHMCHNRACCHPDHLKAGTPRDNWWDSEKTHRLSRSPLFGIGKPKKQCVINGISYGSIAEASESTGLGFRTIVRYIDANGIFDTEAYRKTCGLRIRPRV